ncbi:hypothetical protein [Mucilaginibacter sp.]|uniref:hypothetical protein n=1 Tax=Mucilaginibacter sp. TaxID=1882438 RepID=UPI003D0BFE74
MKANLGSPLTKQEMKSIQGGKLPGCAGEGQKAVAYTNSCCTGLYICSSTGNCWNPSTDPASVCPCVNC